MDKLSKTIGTRGNLVWIKHETLIVPDEDTRELALKFESNTWIICLHEHSNWKIQRIESKKWIA